MTCPMCAELVPASYTGPMCPHCGSALPGRDASAAGHLPPPAEHASDKASPAGGSKVALFAFWGVAVLTVLTVAGSYAFREDVSGAASAPGAGPPDPPTSTSAAAPSQVPTPAPSPVSPAPAPSSRPSAPASPPAGEREVVGVVTSYDEGDFFHLGLRSDRGEVFDLVVATDLPQPGATLIGRPVRARVGIQRMFIEGAGQEDDVPMLRSLTVLDSPPSETASRTTAATWAISEAVAFPPTGPSGPTTLLLALLAAPADEGGLPLTADELRKLLRDPRAARVFRDELVREVLPPEPAAKKKSRPLNYDVFLKPENLALGNSFLARHDAALTNATRASGVAARDVVALLMVQSKLGEATADAKYPLVNVFLGQVLLLDDAYREALGAREPEAKELVAHQKRLERIRNGALRNLAGLLRWCKAKGTDPFSVRGWWAGMIGFPQFMPTSLRWAVDGDGDGAIDLYAPADSIASAAAYLSSHGYATDRAAAVKAYNPNDAWVRGVLAYADALGVEEGSAP